MKKPIIGKKAKVVSSTNRFHKGIEGTIVDESQKTVTIATKEGNKKIWKKGMAAEIEGAVYTIPSRKMSERVRQ